MNSHTMSRMTMVAVAITVLIAFTGFAQEAAPQGAAAPAEKSVAKDKPAQEKAATEKGQYKPLAEARAKIGEIVADPAKMTEVMKELSPEDQKTFVADVNAAIEKLPGSVEDKTAKYLNVNRAALKGATEGNVANVLAVTFATVPAESLTVISERYANDLFNRDADQSHKVSDATFEKTATEVVGKVEQATTGSDDAGVRNTLAILMFVRADNGQIDGLSDRLVETMPDSASRELAKKEWIPAATAEGEGKSYDSMLAYADAGKAPNIDMVISLAGPQILDAMIVDITSSMDNTAGIQTTPVIDQAFGGFDEARVNGAELTDTKSAASTVNGGSEVPRTTNKFVPWNPEYKRGEVQVTPENVDKVKTATIVEQEVDPKMVSEVVDPEPEPEPEPKPYPYSSL